MIIGNNREQVIENIRRAAEGGNFHVKVEMDDPIPDQERLRAVLEAYVENRRTCSFQIKNRIARVLANEITRKYNRTTRIEGMELLNGIEGGAILTCNHFSPFDNTVVRLLAGRMGKKRLCIVSQETNFLMPGLLGFLLKYGDTIPISMRKDYMKKHFEPMLEEILNGGDYVLIYPEQEMWFHYRKPRPLKQGAYYYAARFRVPVIPCFIEMTDMQETDEKGFLKVQYTLHVLKPVYPDPSKPERINRMEMCRQDYQQKKEAYEKAYKRQLTYCFDESDIAGWIKQEESGLKQEINIETGHRAFL